MTQQFSSLGFFLQTHSPKCQMTCRQSDLFTALFIIIRAWKQPSSLNMGLADSAWEPQLALIGCLVHTRHSLTWTWNLPESSQKMHGFPTKINTSFHFIFYEVFELKWTGSIWNHWFVLSASIHTLAPKSYPPHAQCLPNKHWSHLFEATHRSHEEEWGHLAGMGSEGGEQIKWKEEVQNYMEECHYLHGRIKFTNIYIHIVECLSKNTQETGHLWPPATICPAEDKREPTTSAWICCCLAILFWVIFQQKSSKTEVLIP